MVTRFLLLVSMALANALGYFGLYADRASIPVHWETRGKLAMLLTLRGGVQVFIPRFPVYVRDMCLARAV